MHLRPISLPSGLLVLLLLSVVLLSPAAAQIQRTVLIEEFTGAWCGWCPYGADEIESILQDIPAARALSYHYHSSGGYTDTLYTTEGNTFMSAMTNSFPTAAIDRVLWSGEPRIGVGLSSWRTRTNTRRTVTSPLYITVGGTYHEPTRRMTANIHIESWANITGTFNLNCIVSQDEINYRQYRYDPSGQTGQWLNPYYHKHVVRKMITGPSGKTFTTSGFYDGGTRDTTISFVIPSWWNYDNLSLTVTITEMLGSSYKPVVQAYQALMSTIFTPTPVELLSFVALREKQGIRLQWRTASQTNNAGWEVERSCGDDRWTTMAFIPGHGTTQQKMMYEFLDESVNQNRRYAYRLKQIDLDGTVQYSPLSVVETTPAPAAFTLDQNYPNPFNPTTTITYAVPVDGPVRITVTDYLGRLVRILREDIQPAGAWEVMWDGRNDAGDAVAAGLYRYTVTTPAWSATRSMLLVK